MVISVISNYMKVIVPTLKTGAAGEGHANPLILQIAIRQMEAGANIYEGNGASVLRNVITSSTKPFII